VISPFAGDHLSARGRLDSVFLHAHVELGARQPKTARRTGLVPLALVQNLRDRLALDGAEIRGSRARRLSGSAKRQVLGYFKLHKWVERESEIGDLERQWNRV